MMREEKREEEKEKNVNITFLHLYLAIFQKKKMYETSIEKCMKSSLLVNRLWEIDWLRIFSPVSQVLSWALR